MRKLILLLFSAVLIMVAGCCKKEDPYTPVQPEIFPLKLGNHWLFKTTGSNSSVTIHVNDVTKDTTYNSEQWYILTYDTVIQTVCKNNSAGWWFLYYPDLISPPVPALYYHYPAAVNEQYMTADSSRVTVMSISDLVTVPAGKFTCYRYHMIHYREGYECDEYLAPGVGLVFHIVYAHGSGTSSIAEVTELQSYFLH